MAKREQRAARLEDEGRRIRDRAEREFTFSVWDRDPIKQYVRRFGWLEVIEGYVGRRRDDGVDRPLKYLTLPGPNASDVGLLWRSDFLARTSEGFPTVAICDVEAAEKVQASVGRLLGCSNCPFEAAVKWPEGDLCSLFPFDIINLDLSGAVVTGYRERTYATRRLDGIRSVFRLQRGQSFLLFLTTSTDDPTARTYLEDVLIPNLAEGPFRELYIRRYGTIDLSPFQHDYRAFVRLVLPKAIGRMARDRGYRIIEHFVAQYDRPGHKLLSYSFELEPLGRRQLAKKYGPRFKSREEWDELTEEPSPRALTQATKAYQDFLPTIVERDPVDVQGVLTADPPLEMRLGAEAVSLMGWWEPVMKFTDCLLRRDARQLTQVLSPTDPCVDVTITSPPYWQLKDYGAPNQIGYGQSKTEYLADMEKLLADCMLVTKRTGSLWLVVDTYREAGELQLLPFELAHAAGRVGWKLRELIVWDKKYSIPWHRTGQLRNTSEFILFMTKSDTYKYYGERIKTLDEVSKWWVDFPERFNPKGKTPTNIWSIPTRPRGAWRKPSGLTHYCSFPTVLVARIIEAVTDPGDLVMDPFAGSGIVLAQAAAMGRHYLGFEINEEYVRMFEEPVKEEVAAEWEEMKAWRKSQESAKADFEETILKLRALKYARQVTRPFLTALDTEQRGQIRAVLCIALIPDPHQERQPFDVKVVVVVDRPIPEHETALQASKARAARPPLTQYGIRSEIEVATYQELRRRGELPDRMLYLYPTYKPRKHTACGSPRDWFEEGRLTEEAGTVKVPMLSNVAVDVAWVL